MKQEDKKMRKIWILLLGIMLLCGSLFFLACSHQQSYASSESGSKVSKAPFLEPDEVVRKFLETIESGDLKGAEQYMTADAKNFRFPAMSGFSQWTDFVADMLEYTTDVEVKNAEISSFTAKVTVWKRFRQKYFIDFFRSVREHNFVYVLEKENNRWYFDRILGF